MGRCKALLPLDGQPFIFHIIKKMVLVCRRIYIVTGFDEEEIVQAVQHGKKTISPHTSIHVISNPDYPRGMLTSLQAGIRTVSGTEWVLYHFVDQPGLPPEFYREFAGQAEAGYHWIQPGDGKRGGHPILLNRSLFPAILDLPVTRSLKDISRRDNTRKKIWNCSYEQIFQDIDNPDDFLNIK